MKPKSLFHRIAGNLTGVVLLLAAMPLTAMAQANYAAPYIFTTIGYGNYTLFTGIAVDSYGDVYAADLGPNLSEGEFLYEWIPNGTNYDVTTLEFPDAEYDYASGLDYPAGIAVDDAGNLYVADTFDQTIREMTPDGVVTTLAGSQGEPGFADGTGSAARFYYPAGIAVDADGNVFVADTWNNAIRKLTLVGGSWVVTTIAGSPPASYGSFGPQGGFADGVGTAAQFWLPQSVAVDTSNNVYVADTENDAIRVVSAVGSNWSVTTLAGAPCSCCGQIVDGMTCGNVDGLGSAAQFNHPEGVAVDAFGYVYVADTHNNTIRKVAPNGDVTTLAGLPGSYGFVNGTGSAARFDLPTGVAVDTSGNVYVADSGLQKIRMGVAPQVQLVALEVTQVIQDWRNSVILIAGKDTYVRAHMQLLPNSPGPVKVSEALLYAYGPNGPLFGSPIWPINQPDNSVTVNTTNAADTNIRGHFGYTLDFRLPEVWETGSVTLQLVWPGGLQAVNGLPANCSVPVVFQPSWVPKIKFFAVNWSDSQNATYSVNPATLPSMAERVQSCYPVATINADVTYTVLPWNKNVQPDVTAVNEMLKVIARDGPILDLTPDRGILHAAIAAVTIPKNQNIGEAPAIPSTSSSSLVFGTDPYNALRQSVSHEIAHNLGIDHDIDAKLFNTIPLPTGLVQALGACGERGNKDIPPYPLFQPFQPVSVYSNGAPTLGPMTNGDNYYIYGLDTLTLNTTTMEPVIPPTNLMTPNGWCFDLMSYCAGGSLEDCWPSSVTYQSLYNQIKLWYDKTPTPQAVGLIAAGPSLPLNPRPRGGPHPQGGGSGITTYLLARGIVDFVAGTVDFLPCIPLTYTNPPPGEASGTNFLLQALDGSGTVLQETEFALTPSILEHDDTNYTADFIVPLTTGAPIKTLQLWYNGALMGTLVGNDNTPSVALTSPNGGQNFTTGPVNVAWSGSESGESSLTYTVQYSTNAGETWDIMAVDWPGESLSIDSSTLAATTQGMMRVTVSDGLNTAIAQSASTFTVQPHAPAVTIHSPMDGSIFIGNIQLFLGATAIDMQDGALSGTNMQWTSDHDGVLGFGTEVTFNARNLSEGYHTITVTATDSEGLTNSTVTHLWALHYPPPLLNFQSLPGSTNATLLWQAYYTNYLLQCTSNLASGWSAVTTNPPVVAAGHQSVGVTISNVNTFFRLISKQ